LIKPTKKCASHKVTIPDLSFRAEEWVERGIVSGCDPTVRQQSLSDEDAGEWRIVTKKSAGSCPALPKELWDEVFVVLVNLDRIKLDSKLKLWHGNCLAENCSAWALALRLRLVRQAFKLDIEEFYGPCGLDRKTAEAIEAPGSVFLCPSSGLIEQLSEGHGIPEEWLEFGIASEIEV